MTDSPVLVTGGDLVTRIVRDHGIRQVVHFAAYKAVGESMEDPYRYWHNNVEGSTRLIQAGAAMDETIGEDWSSTTNLIPLVMRATLEGHPTLQVFGTDYPTRDGTCIRDYIHVDDLADAHVKALAYLADGGDTTALNVGTGVGSTVLEVLQATERVAGRPVPHVLADRRPGDPAATWAANRLARDTLGWTPHLDLGAIIDSAWTWFSRLAEASRT